MKEENYQIVRAAPRRRDEEYAAAVKQRKPFRKEKSSKCLVYFLVLIVSLGAIVLILASIFLRAKTPEFEIKSVMVNRLTHGNASSPSFNATLVAELTMENNNFGSFKYQNGSGSLWYGIVTVGDMKIGEGLVRARETKTMKINIQVGSNGVLNNTNLTSDINSGMLKLSSYAKLHGRVNLFNFVKKKKSPEMSCSMTLNLTSHAAQDLVCN